MIAERGSGTGIGGMDVMPAPRRCECVRAEPVRRVGPVLPARAEPIGVLGRCAELLLTVRELGVGPLGIALVAAVSAAGPGLPQTLQ